MPISSLTISGVEYDILYETFEIRETVGAVSTIVGDIISTGSPVLRIPVRAPIVVMEDGVKIFSGTIMQSREKGFGGPNNYDPVTGAPRIVTTITAEDHSRLAERITITETVEGSPGTSLEAFLNVLAGAGYLGQFGVTVDGAQVTGPDLPDMAFDHVHGNDVLQALSDATGFMNRIDYDKKLRMWEPGELLAPFDIDENDAPARWTDDVEVEETLDDNYANRVIVIANLPEEKGHIETFPGDGIYDTYQLNYTLTNIVYGVMHVYELDGITPAGGETIGFKDQTFDSDGNPVQWWYDPATNTITRNIGVTDPTKIYSLTFDGFFHAEAVAEDAAEIALYGVYEHVEIRNDITSQAAAQELAEAILAERLNAVTQVVTYHTRYPAPTLRAGQQQGIEAVARDLTGDYIIRDITVRADTPATAVYAAVGLGLIRTVTAKKVNVLTGRYQHTYRDWLITGKSAAPAVTIGAGGPNLLGPAPPERSIQHNYPLGSFAGNPAFLFHPEYTTQTIGLNHTPGGEDGLMIGDGHSVP